jgi:TolA-binding protein
MVEPESGQAGRVDIHGSDPNTLDASLTAMWERARRAVELIGQLREEKRVLQERVRELEGKIQTVQQQYRDVQEQLKAQPHQQVDQDAAPSLLSNGEREALKGRVRDILAKLEAYL